MLGRELSGGPLRRLLSQMRLHKWIKRVEVPQEPERLIGSEQSQEDLLINSE